MKFWRILGRSRFAPPPSDWRDALAARLGQRPRRIGTFAELALFGALSCLDNANENRLPQSMLLSVSSLIGPEHALQAALSDLKTGLPMPISFLQSQPAQVLPVLAQHLGWRGNARCLATRDPLSALHLASLEATSADGMLIGWVDAEDGVQSSWLRAVGEESVILSSAAVGKEARNLTDLFESDVRGFTFAPADVSRLNATCRIVVS